MSKPTESKPKQTEFIIDGKVVSKSAWKKHQKQLQQQQKKASKSAKETKKSKDKAAPSLKNLSPNQYFELRSAMVEEQSEKGVDMYPHKFQVTISVPEFIETYKNLKATEELKQKTLSIAGRVVSIRGNSKKLKFYDFQADGSSIQIVANARDCEDEKSFMEQHEHIRRGDIIGVTGFPGRTKGSDKNVNGELSLFATKTILLAPCLRMLPTSKGGHESGLTHQDTRYRQRYLDLILNKKTRNIFLTRSKIISYIRRFLESRGFLEVETPILNQQAGGAAARPFETFHNELKLPMFLRIAPELYLKELIVGGLDRVFEIGRLFRNEGIDMTHNPEFTTCEFYAAYWDYNDLMKTSEEMLSGMVKEICGSYKIKYDTLDHNGKKVTLDIDFTPPWKRLNMVEELEKKINHKVPKPYESDECKKFLDDCCVKFNVDCGEPRSTTRLFDKLVDHFIESTLINPTFLTCHPEIMSPLAKYHRSIPGLTERFELFVAGKELINAYTELNNPKVQRQKFKEQQKDVEDGDIEAMKYDEDFCVALEYGLPPTGGWGLGIDRLTMFLTNNNTIKEVLLFPQMKPENVDQIEEIKKMHDDLHKERPKKQQKKEVKMPKEDDYFKDCEDERIKEGKTARVTFDEKRLRKCWEECGLGDIDDLKPYCGCVGKIIEIEEDDDTLKLRWENYDEFYIPIKACFDADGFEPTLPSVMNSWLGNEEVKQVEFNENEKDFFTDCDDERIVVGETARVTVDEKRLRKYWDECDLGTIDDLSVYCGCVGKITAIEEDDDSLKLRWENFDEFYIPIKACYSAKGAKPTLPSVMNSWLNPTKQNDDTKVSESDYFNDCEDERIKVGSTVRVTLDEKRLRKNWNECDLGDIDDLTPYCGCVGKVTEIEEDDDTLKLRWENYDEFYIPAKSCFDAKGAPASLPAVQNTWLGPESKQDK